MIRPRLSGVLTQRDIRAFWFGETTSELGTVVSSLAMPLVAVVTLHAGPFAVSTLVAAAWLPWLLLGLPAGAWVDRHRLPPRRLMIVTDMVSALAFASVPVAAWLGVLTLVQLVVCALIGGCASVFFRTGYRVLLPLLAHGDELASANALLQGSQSAASVAGPGVAGLLASLFGAATGVLANAVSFLVSLVCLRSVSDGERPPAATRERRTIRAEVAEGAVFVARDRYLRVLTVWGGVANFALVGFQAVQVVFLVHVVRIGAARIGLLMALASVGGVGGAAVAPRLGRRFGPCRAFIICELVVAPAALLIPLAGPGARALLYATGGFLVAGSFVAGSVLGSTWSQSYAPQALRGRVSACSGVINYGGIPLGALGAGALAASLGTHASVWIMCGLLAVCQLLLLCSPLGRMRAFPDSPDSAPASDENSRWVQAAS